MDFTSDSNSSTSVIYNDTSDTISELTISDLNSDKSIQSYIDSFTNSEANSDNINRNFQPDTISISSSDSDTIDIDLIYSALCDINNNNFEDIEINELDSITISIDDILAVCGENNNDLNNDINSISSNSEVITIKSSPENSITTDSESTTSELHANERYSNTGVIGPIASSSNESFFSQATTVTEQTFYQRALIWKNRTPFSLIHLTLRNLIENNRHTRFLQRNAEYFEREFNQNKFEKYHFSITGVFPQRKVAFNLLRHFELRSGDFIYCFCKYNNFCSYHDVAYGPTTLFNCCCVPLTSYNMHILEHTSHIKH